MIYITLFAEFLKTGLFAVGGGLATLPFLYDMAEKYTWFTKEMLANMIAIAESTPGPIGVNVATYAGFSAAGLPGAACATLGLVLPSFIIIAIISRFLKRFGSNFYVQSAFYGIRPAATALIAVAAISMIKTAIWSTEQFDIIATVMFLILIVLTNKFKKLHPIWFIVLAAVIGMIKGAIV